MTLEQITALLEPNIFDPEAAQNLASVSAGAAISTAISTKRIADLLEGMSQTMAYDRGPSLRVSQA